MRRILGEYFIYNDLILVIKPMCGWALKVCSFSKFFVINCVLFAHTHIEAKHTMMNNKRTKTKCQQGEDFSDSDVFSRICYQVTHIYIFKCNCKIFFESLYHILLIVIFYTTSRQLKWYIIRLKLKVPRYIILVLLSITLVFNLFLTNFRLFTSHTHILQSR